MRAFAQLVSTLDATNRESEQLAALEGYVRSTPAADAAWALWFLSGQRYKRALKPARLREWGSESAGLPLWLVEECYAQVGDLAETLALLLPASPHPGARPLAQLVEECLLPMADATEANQRELLRAAWDELDTPQRFVWHKLLTGHLRVGVSRSLVVRALAQLAGVEPPVMAHRLLGAWHPTPADLARLLRGNTGAADPGRPYPFHLASPLVGEPEALGDVADWQFEWQWDGIRVQLIRRGGEVVFWSRGEEFITDGIPEVAEAAQFLPEGTVLDGELLAWRHDAPLPFLQLQRRLNRRSATPALRREVPITFMAYDLLEKDGEDWRHRPLADRRRGFEQLVRAARDPRALDPPPASATALVQGELFPCPAPVARPAPPLQISVVLPATAWEDVAAWHRQARAAGAEGLMLKRRDSEYGTGRQRGGWWKWKAAPFKCDAVLVAAQPGHGRRAPLFTDYTFAVWDDTRLVPVAKASAGLTDEEIGAVDAFVRSHTAGRFGPVRSVSPEMVFELTFEGIALSTRHKAGLALRSPRIARWRHDKPPEQADTLASLRSFVENRPVLPELPRGGRIGR